jgi:maltooligosyltrehalose synthase
MAEGSKAEHIVAFERTHRDERLLVVVPRLTSTFGPDLPIREKWDDTVIRIPGQEAASWRCHLGGQVVQSRNGTLAVADLTSRLPVAVLAPHR